MKVSGYKQVIRTGNIRENEQVNLIKLREYKQVLQTRNYRKRAVKYFKMFEK